MKNMFFDLDGTLIDSSEGITKAAEYALNYYGVKVENRKNLKKFIGPPIYDSFSKYYNFDKEKSKQAVSKFREYYSKIGILESRLYDGIKELLRDLYEGGNNLIIATSKPQVFTERILAIHQIDKYFKFICGATLDGSLIDKADIIKCGIDELNIVNKEECIMVGDTKFDIIGAKENNMNSIGVMYGFGSKDDFEDATYIAQNVEELRKILM